MPTWVSWCWGVRTPAVFKQVESSTPRPQRPKSRWSEETSQWRCRRHATLATRGSIGPHMVIPKRQPTPTAPSTGTSKESSSKSSTSSSRPSTTPNHDTSCTSVSGIHYVLVQLPHTIVAHSMLTRFSESISSTSGTKVSSSSVTKK